LQQLELKGSTLGGNNTFVISDRKTGRELAEASKRTEAQ
jgi:hypothetical protein